jgi:hypothetical protein
MVTKRRLETRAVKLGDLVQDYRTGRIVIPEFQRDYVWAPNKAPTLLDSLYKSYPVASLLLWRNADYERARRRTPKPAREVSNWLIDGQQRLMTISRSMYGDDERIEVVFNAETDEFKLINARLANDPAWVRVSLLFDDDSWRDIRGELPTGPRGRRTEAAYDRVRAIMDYEIPVVTMINHPFDDAVEAFTRINKLGVKLKKQDIENAKTAAQHSGFISEDVVPYMEKLDATGLRRLSVMHLFRVCESVARPDGRTRTPLHELKNTEVKAAWRVTEKAALEARRIIQSELGLVNMDIIWSGALLVPLIAMLAKKRSARDSNPRAMIGWLALAALHHRYSKGANTALDQDVRACRAEDPIGALLGNLRQYHREALLSTPEDFKAALNDRNGLLATYIACRHRAMKDLFTGQTIILQESIDRHHILPRRQFPEAERAKTADQIANISFITSEVNSSINQMSPEVYLKDIRPDILASQCIPEDSTLWYIDKSSAFFRARMALLSEAFNDFVRECLPGRHLS